MHAVRGTSRSLAVAALLSLAVVPAAHAKKAKKKAAAEPPAPSLVDQALVRVDTGDLAGAETIAAQAVAAAPADPRARRVLADVRFARKDCPGALVAFREWRDLLTTAATKAKKKAKAAAQEAATEAATIVTAREADCAKPATGTVELLLDADADCVIDDGKPQQFPANWRIPLELTAGDHTITCLRPDVDLDRTLVTPVPALGTGERRELRLALPAPPPPPPPEPEPLPDLPPPEPAKTTGRLTLTFADRNWLCRLDDAPGIPPSEDKTLVIDVEAGTHGIQCERSIGSGAFEETLTIAGGDERTIVVEVPPPPPPPPEPPPPPPAPRRPALAQEFLLGVGFAPGTGNFGLRAGYRFQQFGLMVGSGLQPLAIEGVWFAAAGESGPYVSAGWQLLGPSLFVGGASTWSNAVFATAGFDVRAVEHLSLRIGAGYAYSFLAGVTGPLVLEVTAAYAP